MFGPEKVKTRILLCDGVEKRYGPIPRTSEEIDDDFEYYTEFCETLLFDAGVHVKHIEDVFELFGLNLHEWAICQIADNVSVNKRIAKILDIPHLGCLSYKLNLDMKRMFRNNDALRQEIDSVQAKMQECSMKIKNRALRRSITDLSPVLPSETRWSGKFEMVERFNNIYSELLHVSQSKNGNSRIDNCTCFKRNVIRANKQLEQINIVTLVLESEKNTLSNSRLAFDSVFEAI